MQKATHISSGSPVKTTERKPGPAASALDRMTALPAQHRNHVETSLAAGLLPVLVPREWAVRWVVDMPTAGPADLRDLSILDHVVWPPDLELGVSDRHFPEARRLTQLMLLLGDSRRLDLTLSWDLSAADVGGMATQPLEFAARCGAEDASRYLAFLQRCTATRESIPANHGPELAQTLGCLLDRLSEDVDRALARAVTTDSDYRRELMDHLALSRKAADIPWDRLRPTTTGLAILYNFAPFADTGSTVASKRLRDMGRTMDVISCSWINHKKIDPTVSILSRPYVAEQRYLDMRPSWATWAAYEGFCREGLDEIERLESRGHHYDVLYSRANWASSHYLATAYKMRRPEIEWTAEFSDPLSLDVQGNRRGDSLDRQNPFLAELVAPVEARFGPIPDEHFTIFGLAEILPFALAETVLFTNAHQKTDMLDNVYTPELAEHVDEHSIVSNHPTLPPAYYGARKVDYAVDPGKLNLAYFGEFYPTRGITDLTVALKMLPPRIRDHVHLHVFTNFIPEGGLNVRPAGFSPAGFKALVQRAQDGVGAHGIEHLVTFNPALPYLEFLGVTSKFDYLIVNDAHSGSNHSVNPFLPSKWSDYAGSRTPAWALVERGSILSSKPALVKTPVGDPNAARDIFWRLIEEKTGDCLDG